MKKQAQKQIRFSSAQHIVCDIYRDTAAAINAAKFVPAEASKFVVGYYNKNRTSVFYAIATDGSVQFVPDPHIIYKGVQLPSSLTVKLFDDVEADDVAAKNPTFVGADGWVYHVEVRPLYEYFADVQLHYNEKYELMRQCKEKDEYIQE